MVRRSYGRYRGGAKGWNWEKILNAMSAIGADSDSKFKRREVNLPYFLDVEKPSAALQEALKAYNIAQSYAARHTPTRFTIGQLRDIARKKNGRLANEAYPAGWEVPAEMKRDKGKASAIARMAARQAAFMEDNFGLDPYSKAGELIRKSNAKMKRRRKIEDMTVEGVPEGDIEYFAGPNGVKAKYIGNVPLNQRGPIIGKIIKWNMLYGKRYKTLRSYRAALKRVQGKQDGARPKAKKMSRALEFESLSLPFEYVDFDDPTDAMPYIRAAVNGIAGEKLSPPALNRLRKRVNAWNTKYGRKYKSASSYRSAYTRMKNLLHPEERAAAPARKRRAGAQAAAGAAAGAPPAQAAAVAAAAQGGAPAVAAAVAEQAEAAGEHPVEAAAQGAEAGVVAAAVAAPHRHRRHKKKLWSQALAAPGYPLPPLSLLDVNDDDGQVVIGLDAEAVRSLHISPENAQKMQSMIDNWNENVGTKYETIAELRRKRRKKKHNDDEDSGYDSMVV